MRARLHHSGCLDERHTPPCFVCIWRLCSFVAGKEGMVHTEIHGPPHNIERLERGSVYISSPGTRRGHGKSLDYDFENFSLPDMLPPRSRHPRPPRPRSSAPSSPRTDVAIPTKQSLRILSSTISSPLLSSPLSPMALFLPLLCSSLVLAAAVSSQPLLPNACNERCGRLAIPSPFYVNSSCGLSLVPAFRLSCPPNSSLPRLSLGTTDLPVLAFLPSSSLLLDYSSSFSSFSPSSCSRWYADLNSSTFGTSSFFGVTSRNVLRLYDCEDSSVCKAGCEDVGSGACEGGGVGNNSAG